MVSSRFISGGRVRSLERPILPSGYASGQKRLAATFLKNTPENNLADTRLAAAKGIVDTAMQIARERAESARMVTSIGESTCQYPADRIKSGSAIEAELHQAAEKSVESDKDRSR